MARRISPGEAETKDFGYIVDHKDLFTKVENAIAVYSSELDHSAGGAAPEVLLQDRLKKGKERLDIASVSGVAVLVHEVDQQPVVKRCARRVWCEPIFRAPDAARRSRHGAVPAPLSRAGCSRQFGRASAPMMPHHVHTRAARTSVPARDLARGPRSASPGGGTRARHVERPHAVLAQLPSVIGSPAGDRGRLPWWPIKHRPPRPRRSGPAVGLLTAGTRCRAGSRPCHSGTGSVTCAARQSKAHVQRQSADASHGGTCFARRYASQAQSRRRRWPERPGFTGAAPSETIGSPVQLRLDPPLCARPP
jgi:hypothetical protein